MWKGQFSVSCAAGPEVLQISLSAYRKQIMGKRNILFLDTSTTVETTEENSPGEEEKINWGYILSA